MDIQARLDQHGEMFVEVRERLSGIEAQLVHMATKEDLAELGATLVGQLDDWPVIIQLAASN
jgi:hypothetical protein